jgi:hypothetical protein
MVPIVVFAALSTAACGDDMITVEPTELAAVIPAGGAVDVSVHTNIIITTLR